MPAQGEPEERTQGVQYRLEGAVITAYRDTPSLYSAASGLTLLDSERIESREVYAPSRIIETVPNINLEGTNKGAFYCPGIRGFGASNNIILIDGVPVNTGFANWGSILSLPSHDIDRIEVLRGSNTIIYGPNAMGGVVNIMTTGPERENRAGGDIRVGSNGFQRMVLDYGFDRGGGDYLITVSHDQENGYLRNTDMEALNLSFKTDRRGEGSRLRIRADYADAEVGVPLDPNAPQRYDYWRNGRSSIAYENQLTARLSLSTHAFVNLERSRLIVYTDTTMAEIEDDFHNSGSTVGAEVTTNALLSQGNLVSVGLEAKKDRLDMAYIGGEQGFSLVGVFVQDVIATSEYLTVNLGGRADRHTISGDVFNYNVGAVVRPSGSTSPSRVPVFRVSYGTTSRFPALRELYMTDPAPGRGDPTLDKEEGRGFEVGLEQCASSSIKARVTYFRTRARELIERDLTVKPWVFANLGSVTMNGIEVELKGEGPRWHGYFLAISTLDARELDTGDDLDFRPGLKISGGMRHGSGPLTGYLTGRYIGSQRYTVKNPQTGEVSTETIADYFLLETRIVLSLATYGKLSFAVSNLLDEDYDVEGHQQATPILPGPGREYVFGYSVDL